ncbi:MAG: hypothetical protein IPN76_13435 [Saprospiraceae bacterium]|nr:hypothetical protein [Saprospiraceae bacterium]
MQNIIATWKKLEGEADKKAFLEQIKQEVGAKSGEQQLNDVKVIGELVSALHAEVVQPKVTVATIEVYPADAEEAKLIEDLLGRMRVS